MFNIPADKLGHLIAGCWAAAYGAVIGGLGALGDAATFEALEHKAAAKVGD